MKIIASFIFLFTLIISFAQEKPSQMLPPLEILEGKPGDIKNIYELPAESDYQIFDQMGELITEGTAQFIDYTQFNAGKYFIKYNGTTQIFEKKETH